MIISKYNFQYNIDGKEYIYNSLSNIMVEIEPVVKKAYESFKMNPNLICIHEDKELIEAFQNVKVIVESDEEELEQFNYFTNLVRYNTSHMYLTLAPTQECNFNCSYCYESHRIPSYMNETTRDSVIKFIKKARQSH